MKNVKFTTRHVKAKRLMADDWFKMAGRMYRIAQVQKNMYNCRIITFYPVHPEPYEPPTFSTLIVPKNTVFKIWNQK